MNRRLSVGVVRTKPCGGERAGAASTSGDLIALRHSLRFRQAQVLLVAVLALVPMVTIHADDLSDASWPVWRQDMMINEWRSIPGTSLAAIAPSPRPQGYLAARVGAWNGMAADQVGNRLFIAGVGGHLDYSGNEAYALELSVDAPRWELLNQPTPAADVVLHASYYRDGRPSATHTYYSLQYVAPLDRVFRVGSGANWSEIAHSDWHLNAFNLSTRDWDPAGQWPDVDSVEPTMGRAVCTNDETGDIYAVGHETLRHFDPASAHWRVLSDLPEDGSAFYMRPCVVDAVGGHIVFLGDQFRLAQLGCVTVSILTGALQERHCQGPAARAMIAADKGGAVIDAAHRTIWYVSGAVGGEVFRIDADSLTVTRLATRSGAAIPEADNGVWNRWQYLPALGGIAYLPNGSGNVWFLATAGTSLAPSR